MQADLDLDAPAAVASAAAVDAPGDEALAPETTDAVATTAVAAPAADQDPHSSSDEGTHQEQDATVDVALTEPAPAIDLRAPVDEPALATASGTAAADADLATPDLTVDPHDMPSFVRQAERAARWRSPKVRAALAVGCFVGAAGLAGQWLVAQRDLTAARSPALKPLLEAACATLGCEVRPPRALEGLRVESSGVVRADRADHYRVNVVLRNLRGHEVAVPAFELALTDTQGQLIARRVLQAADLGARSGALAAGAELPLQCTIQVASGTVAGYTIELFYP